MCGDVDPPSYAALMVLMSRRNCTMTELNCVKRAQLQLEPSWSLWLRIGFFTIHRAVWQQGTILPVNSPLFPSPQVPDTITAFFASLSAPFTAYSYVELATTTELAFIWNTYGQTFCLEVRADSAFLPVQSHKDQSLHCRLVLFIGFCAWRLPFHTQHGPFASNNGFRCSPHGFGSTTGSSSDPAIVDSRGFLAEQQFT